MVRKKQISDFNENGFIIVKKLISINEIKKVFLQLNLTIDSILEYNKISYNSKLSIDEKYFLLKKINPKLKSKFYDSIRILDSFNNIIYSSSLMLLLSIPRL